MSQIDLHVHSTRSDGTYTPTQLVDYAMVKGLTAFALTDHDTVDGLGEAFSYAEGLRADGVPNVPEIIPGVELSTEYQGRDIHIVGLFIDYHSQPFLDYLERFVESRDLRNRKMCALLQDAGIDISYEKLMAEFPDAIVTRAHYAKYLLKYGYTHSMKEAFERYVGDHCPYFVPREKVTPAQAVELILAADGIPILAHPILYRMSDARLDTLTAELKAVGLMGIEAVYSTYSTAEERQIRQLAAKYHLLVSGGSDFHGANKPGLDLAVGYGKLYVPSDLLDEMKKTRKNLLFTDMDGTLLLSDSTVSPAMHEALDRMTAVGHHLILSSGRPLPSILEVRHEQGLEYPHTLILSNNGAFVYDCDSDAPILEYRISHEDVKALVEAAEEMGLHIHGYTARAIVCHEMNDEMRFYTRRIHMPLTYTGDLAAAMPNGTYKLQMISLTDHARLEAFRDRYLDRFDGRIQMIFSNENYLEILPIEAGKGKALRFIADYLHAPLSHTFAAGDAENDISMIAAAGTGIAMANAQLAVKTAADLVTARTNDEDGLLEILEQYFQ